MYVNTGKQQLKYEVSPFDNFITHHLNNEKPISSFTNASKIKARQIIEHYIFKDIVHRHHNSYTKTSQLTEFAVKTWLQRLFIDILDKAEYQYFNNQKSYEEVKAQLVEEYIFEIYQMHCFINAGLSKYSSQ